MIHITNKIFISIFSALFFIAAGCYAYWQEIYFLLVPVLLLGAILLVQHPEYLFYLLMLSMPWSIEFNFTQALGTDLPDEPLMLLAALSLIFYLIYQHKKIQLTSTHPLLILILLQFLWTVITVITSLEIVVSLKYLLAKSWYLLAFLVLPVSLFKDVKVFKRSVILLVSSMMLVTLVALIRHGNYRWSFENVNDALFPFFRNHVNYSALLVMMVPIQIAILTVASSKRIRFFLSCILVVTVIALYFSYARGAWLAFLGGLLAYWLIRHRLLAFSFLLFWVMIIGSVTWISTNDRFIKFSNDYRSTIFHTNFKEHMIATYQLKDVSNAERIYRWVAGVRMIGDNWKTGFGPSTFYYQYKSYTLPSFKTYVSNNPEHSTVHNYFLLVLIEQGVIGFLLFIALLTMLFWYCQKIYFRTNKKFWKAVVSAVAAILVMQCTVNFLSDLVETDKVGSIFYLCIATLILADIKTKNSNLTANVEGIS